MPFKKTTLILFETWVHIHTYKFTYMYMYNHSIFGNIFRLMPEKKSINRIGSIEKIDIKIPNTQGQKIISTYHQISKFF